MNQGVPLQKGLAGIERKIRWGCSASSILSRQEPFRNVDCIPIEQIVLYIVVQIVNCCCSIVCFVVLTSNCICKIVWNLKFVAVVEKE